MAAIVASPASPPSVSRSNSAAKANSNATARPSTVSHAGSSDAGVVPGSFPRNPHVPPDHLSDKAAANGTDPLTDTGTILGAVQEDFRHAMDVAASYLPGSVVGAMGYVLPVGMTNTEEASQSLESDRTSSSQVGQSSKRVVFKDVAIGGIASDFTPSRGGTTANASTRSDAVAFKDFGVAGVASESNPSSTKQITPVDDALDTPAATPTPVPRGESTDLRRKAIEATAIGAGIGTLGGAAYHHNQVQTPDVEAQRESKYANDVQQGSPNPATQTQFENVPKGEKAAGATVLGGGASAIDGAALDQSRAHQLPTPPSSPSVAPTSQAEAQGASKNDENPAFVSYAPGPIITEDTPFPDEEDEDESTEKEKEKGLPAVPTKVASVTESSPVHGDIDENGTSPSNGKDAGNDKSNKVAALGLGAGAVGAGGAAALAQSHAKENNNTTTAASPEAPQVPPNAASRSSVSGGVGTPTPSTSSDRGKVKDVTSRNGLEGAAVGAGAGAGALGSAAAYQHQQATPAVPAKETPSSGILEPAATPTTGMTGPDPQNKATTGVAGPTGTNGSSSIEKKDLEKEQQKAIKEAGKREKDAKKLEKEASAAEKEAAKEANARAKEEKHLEKEIKEIKKEKKLLSKERKEFEKEQAEKENGKKTEDEKEEESKDMKERVATGAVAGGGAGIASKQLQKEEEPEKAKISPEQSGKPKEDDVAQQFSLPSEHRSADANTSAASPEHPSVTSASDTNKRNKQVAAGAAAVGAGAGIGAGIAGDKLDSGEAKKVDPDQESQQQQQQQQQQQLGVDSNNLAVPGNVHPSIKAASPHPVRPGAVASGAAAPNQRPGSGADSDFPLPSVDASTEDVPQAVAISGQGLTSSDSGAARQDQEQLSTPVARTQSDRARYHGTEGLQEKYSGGALRSSFIEKKTDEEEENVGHRRTQSQGTSDRKKEGFVRHLVEKVKDKLHHHEK